MRTGSGGGINKKKTQRGEGQEVVDAGAAFDTHSTVWMVHGEVARVLPGRHTEDNGENKNNDFLENILHLF